MGTRIQKAIALTLCFILCFMGVVRAEDLNISDSFDDGSDAFVEISIATINMNSDNIVALEPKDIVVHSIQIKEITAIETDIVSINDEFVTLAYENFVAYYGDDFDFGEFIKNVSIGAGVFLVWVTLSTVGGPVGTFFGAVIASELAPAALIVGAAIDAAVEGWKAYQDGGDLSYILGHMLNGVAEGFKWSAFLAPFAGAPAGIKALKAVKALRKIPGLEEITHQQAQKLFKQLPELLKDTAELASKMSDDALRNAAKKLPKSFTSEFGEDLLVSILKNRSVISKITQKFNPFNMAKEVLRSLQSEFIKRSQIDERMWKEILARIKRGTIKSIKEIDDDALREFINTNLQQFLEYYGGSLPKRFLENCLEESVSTEILASVKKIVSHKNSYLELIAEHGKSRIDEILDNPSTLSLLQARFGLSNVQRLRDLKLLYNTLGKNNPSEKALVDIISGILDKSISTIDDVAKIDQSVADNLFTSRDVVYNAIKDLGLEKQSSNLLSELAVDTFRGLGISEETASNIVRSHLTKSAIDSSIYEEMIKNYSMVVQALGKTQGNRKLIEELTTDALKTYGISDDVIKLLLKGQSMTTAKILPEAALRIGPILSDYYQYQNKTIYANFIMEYADLRGKAISSFVEQFEQDSPLINKSYFAGCVMTPTGSNANYILERYGDIYMTDVGFPVFDGFAISRIEIDDLVGIDSLDIARANMIHHGTAQSVPGYTWHHLEDGKTLILIPTELHEAYRHTGGASLIREGLKEVVE